MSGRLGHPGETCRLARYQFILNNSPDEVVEIFGEALINNHRDQVARQMLDALRQQLNGYST